MKQILFFFFISAFTYAQNDSIQILEEVKLHGNFSKKINAGYQIQVLSDSIINNSVQSLGELLQNKANLYFKQNGNGMVSSISLRGSGASHTGVYWNGIAINSSLNGQTDFNTLSANGFNQIEIRKGGGSTLFGSGAIGGAINLKDKINYSPTLENEFKATIDIASYNTQNLFIQNKISNHKYYFKVSMEGGKSDNDYPFLDTNPKIINENAKYKNQQIKAALAYKINKNNQLKIFTNYSYNNRELARTITAPNKNLYKNKDNKLLLNWLNTGSKYNSSFNIAYLKENYQFYLDKNLEDFSFGETENYIAKYDFKYLVKNNLSLLIGIENKFIKSNGSNILSEERNVLESYALFHHQVMDIVTYNLSVRKGNTKVFSIPLIYSIDTRFDFGKHVNLRANYSTNYRIPSFNDLYWEFSGNENLIPETSNSTEIGLFFNNKNINTNVSLYQIKSDNLIQWRPETAYLWKPINVQSVTNKGIEFSLDYSFKLKNHHFNLASQYAYTKATDDILNKQLMYVPFYKVNTNFNYNYKRWSLIYNYQYNGSVFTTTSNTQFVDKFGLHNIQLHKKVLKNTINIGFYINNLFNKKYQVVAYRPMPNRNYKLNINIKI